MQRSAFSSYIRSLCNYNLNAEINGEVYKPDSFYMEATKPEIK